MTVTIELRPEIEARAVQIANKQGRKIEELLVAVIESGLSAAEDPRLTAMREAVNDELFMADLREVMEDFKYADAEQI